MLYSDTCVAPALDYFPQRLGVSKLIRKNWTRVSGSMMLAGEGREGPQNKSL
jgi:hypothetical protein